MTLFYQLLEDAEEKFNEEVSNIATTFRKEELIPFCEKYQIEFISGMGSYFFSTDITSWCNDDLEIYSDPNTFDVEDPNDHEQFVLDNPTFVDDCLELFAIMDEDVGGLPFGLNLSDVRLNKNRTAV